MPSNKPKPDRCAASVTTKIGLEVHASDVAIKTSTLATESDDLPENLLEVDVALDDFTDYVDEGRRTNSGKSVDDYDYHFDDQDFDEIVIARDDEPPVELAPDYEDVLSYLRSGFDVIGLHLSLDLDHPAVEYESEKASSGATVDVDVTIDDADPYVRNRTTELEGYCLRYPMDNGRCYVHGGTNPGPGEDNTNAMTHGLRAKRSNFYKALDDEDKAFIDAMVDSWLSDAPFERDNAAKVNELYRIGIDQLRLWFAVDEYVDEDGSIKDLAYEQTIGIDEETGDPIQIEQENPVNLPYSRLDGDVLRKLKDLGVLDSPEDKQAEATASLAQRLSGLSDDK